ncbi:MAG: phosphatase [Legionella sp.]|nr:MAG: phosphatase [Legionella sp.]
MRWLVMLFLVVSSGVQADTIDNYMKIADNIPKMEVKADEQAQAWARSARHVLTITCESIAETILQANETATSLGKPIFCLPQGTQLNPEVMNNLIQQTYKEISSQGGKDKLTVSQVAWLGVNKQFACNKAPVGVQGLLHVSGTN